MLPYCSAHHRKRVPNVYTSNDISIAGLDCICAFPGTDDPKYAGSRFFLQVVWAYLLHSVQGILSSSGCSIPWPAWLLALNLWLGGGGASWKLINELMPTRPWRWCNHTKLLKKLPWWKPLVFLVPSFRQRGLSSSCSPSSVLHVMSLLPT